MNAHTSFADAFDIARDRLAIGTPCDRPGGAEVAYIVAIAKAEGATYTLFGGAEPMSRDRLTLTLASASGVTGLEDGTYEDRADLDAVKAAIAAVQGEA